MTVKQPERDFYTLEELSQLAEKFPEGSVASNSIWHILKITDSLPGKRINKVGLTEFERNCIELAASAPG